MATVEWSKAKKPPIHHQGQSLNSKLAYKLEIGLQLANLTHKLFLKLALNLAIKLGSSLANWL